MIVKKSYKIALMYLEAKSYEEKKKALFNIIEEIKKGEVKNKQDFISLAKINEINDRDIGNIIQQEIDRGSSIKDFLIFLSEGTEGIKYIPKSWFARNLDDKDVLKRVPNKYWDLVRSPKWIEQNK